MDFTGVTALSIPEGAVAKITNAAGDVIWEKPASDGRDLYQRVESVTTTGGSTGGWFLTDFIANNQSGLELTFSVPTFSDTATMGSRTSASNTRCYVFYPRSASMGYIGWNTAIGWSVDTPANTKCTTRLNWLNSRKAVLLNENGTTKSTKSFSGTLVQQVSPIAICRYNNATSTPTSGRAMTVFSVRCSQGSEVVREYLPCYRKSDGEIGLWEVYTGQFVPNKNVSGLSKGADIDW